MSVANQKVIMIKKEKCSKQDLYTVTNLKALQKAMIELKGETFKLWVFLGKNQNNYRLELSQKVALEWGIKKDAYYKGVETLIEKGYLVPLKEGSNIYNFIESGFSEIQKNSIDFEEKEDNDFSEIQNQISEKPKKVSEIQKNFSEKTERNITNTTKTIQDNNKEFGLEVESEKEIDWVAENRKIMIKLQDMYETATQEVKEKIEEVETILRTEFTKEEIKGECAEEIYFLFLEYFPNINI